MPQDFSPASARSPRWPPGSLGPRGSRAASLIGAVVKKAQARLPHRRGRPGRPPAGAGVPDGPGLRHRHCPRLRGGQRPNGPWMRNTWGFPSSPWVYPRWWRRPPLCLDLLDQAGQEGFDPALFRQEGAEWFVTPETWTARWRPLPGAGPGHQHRAACGLFRGRCGKVDLISPIFPLFPEKT